MEEREGTCPPFSTACLFALGLVCLATHTGVAHAQSTPPGANAETDPWTEWRGALMGRLRPHSYFSQVKYSAHDKKPFVFLVQRHPKDQQNYERRIIALYEPWMRKLEAIFETRYARPQGLKRRATVPGYALGVLATRGDYDNFARAVRAPSLHRALAHFEPRLGISVTYENRFVKRTEREKRQSVLHEFVHALQNAYFGGTGRMPHPIWFNEGLAEYLSSFNGNRPDALDKPTVNTNRLTELVSAMQNPQYAALVHPVKDLVSIGGDYSEIPRRIAKRMQGQTLTPQMQVFSVGVFYAQATMFMHFLHEGLQGRYRDRLVKYVGSVMRGERGWEPFERAFAGVDSATLDREFRQHVNARAGFVSSAGQSPPGGEGGKQAAAGAPRAFSGEAFGLNKLADDDRLAGAVALAGDGLLQAALDLLGAASADKKRLARERTRIEKLLEFRSEGLGQLIGSGKSVEFMLGSEKVKGKVTKVEDGHLTLSLKNGARRVPLRGLSAANLYKARLALQRSTRRDWLAGYTLLLSGAERKRIKAKLNGKDELSVSLLADLDETIALVKNGAAVALLARAAAQPVPDDPRQASARLELLARELRAHGSSPIITERRGALRGYAAALLDRKIVADNPEGLPLNGKLQVLGKRRVRVTYDFSSPSQMRDFVRANDYLADHPARQMPFKNAVANSSTIAGGALTLQGSQCVRHFLALAEPYEIHYEVVYPFASFFFLCGVNDDAMGNQVLVDTDGSMEVIDKNAIARGVPMLEAGELRQGFQIQVGSTYTYRVTRKAKSVMSVLDNKQRDRESTTLPGHGSVFFWVHVPAAIKIGKVILEGELTDAAMAVTKKQLIERELDRLLPAK